MAQPQRISVSKLLAAHEAEILTDWLQRLKDDGALKGGRIKEAELSSQTTTFLRQLWQGLEGGASDLDAAGFSDLRETINEISRSRAVQGFSPRETAMFVLSLKQPLYDAFERHGGGDAASRYAANWSIGVLLDRFALFTMEVVPESARGADRAPAARDFRTFHAGHQAVGRHSWRCR